MNKTRVSVQGQAPDLRQELKRLIRQVLKLFPDMMTIFGWILSSSLLHFRFRSFLMVSSSSCLSTASLNHKLEYALLSVNSKKSIYRI